MKEQHTPPGFTDVLEFIDAEMDFEPGYYNDAYLDRRISARVRRTNSEDYREYLDVLVDDDSEQNALLDSLSINVTSFFRNPAVWESLRSVLRDLSRRRRPRLWSAPSSDGREPYSLAMLLLDDPEIDAHKFEILATDINEEILEIAREGVYHTTRTTDIESELSVLSDFTPYIDSEGDAYRVRDSVRKMVTFEHHDLLHGDPKSDFDLVTCRNLLIYVDVQHKQPVMETVAASLRDGGYLTVGMTETLPREIRPEFTPVDKRARIYRKT